MERSRRKQVVYVVDDESTIAETLAMILNRSGFSAFAFDDPLRALESVDGQPPPDLLISDVMMPQMTGIDLAIRFREVYPKCRVLLFSGKSATADLLDAAREKGYDFDLLSKPIYPADLLARLTEQTHEEEDRQDQVSK